MGRKRQSPDERRSEAMTILLRPAEARELRQGAKGRGLSLSSFCRSLLFCTLEGTAVYSLKGDPPTWHKTIFKEKP